MGYAIASFIRGEGFSTGLNTWAGRHELEQLLAAKGAAYKDDELAVYDLFRRTNVHYETQTRSDLRSTLAQSMRRNGGQITDEMLDEVAAWKDRVGHKPAYIIVLGLDPDNPEHTAHLLNGNYKGACIGKRIGDPKIAKDLEKIAYQDGAILVKPDGTVYATNVNLVDVNARNIFLDRYGGELPPGAKCSDLCGFEGHANTRQYSSIAASYQLPGVVVYTLSEDEGTIRRFEKGLITFSTHPKEHPRTPDIVIKGVVPVAATQANASGSGLVSVRHHD
jgi:hypothetical protein